MKTKGFKFSLLIFSAVLLSSCSTSGLFKSTNVTNVELSEDNYTMVAKNIEGEAQAKYILGFSLSFRGELQTFAFVRVQGDGMLYQQAMENLWKNYEDQTSSEVEGRKLALVNVRYDSDALNLLGLYSRPKVSIRADIIEFGS